MKTLHNPTEHNIEKYRIEEYQTDAKTEEVLLDKEGNPLKTGRTLEWSIKAGETLSFPNYVADYLKNVYNFLEEMKEMPKQEKEIKEKPTETISQPMVGQTICKYCDQSFKGKVQYGLHLGSKHPEMLN